MFKNRFSQAHSVDLVAPVLADIKAQVATLSTTGKALYGLTTTVEGGATIESNTFNAQLHIRAPRKIGSTSDQADLNFGSAQQIELTFAGPLVTGNVVNLVLTYKGNSITVSPVNFVTDSNTTMQAVATAITNALPVGGSAGLLAVTGSQLDRQIVINSPTTGPNTLGVTSATVTGGASQITIGHTQTVAGVATQGPKGAAQSIVNGFNSGSTLYNYGYTTASLGADGLRVNLTALPKIIPNADSALTQKENNTAAQGF